MNDNPTVKELARNDIELLFKGFYFEQGELDWYENEQLPPLTLATLHLAMKVNGYKKGELKSDA